MGEITILNGERHKIIQCGTCAVWHTVPEIVWSSAYNEGGFWSCPNGHQRGYQTGDEKRKQEEIRRERDRLKQETARLQDEVAAETRRALEAEKKYLQARKRAAAGVCPCCNRTFTNVQRHMKTKHPNVVPLEQKTA